MKSLDEDLDDSAVFCKSLIQKRKATGCLNPKASKQLKLTFSQSLNESSQQNKEKQMGGKNSEISLNKTTTKSSEMHSSYFSTKKSTSTCPLCLKSFKTDSAYSGHMKQCAKTHKMTTQQLLAALELQKKQMQERRELGLCSQNITPPLKPTVKKKKENYTEQYDLALGLALSKSLTEVPKSTLEEFGFTSNCATAGPSKRRNEIDRKSILKERTLEDRQKIIVEKVAIVLLEENQTCQPKNLNSDLNGSNDQVPQLWSMGENNENRGWYVDNIRTLVLSENENPQENPKPSESIHHEISQLNLPRNEIYENWKKLINNSKLSDLTVTTKDCEDIYLHSLVMFARCPEMLEKDCKTIFEKFYSPTVTTFLEYLYCGTLNGLTRTEVNNLFDLASDFNFTELINVLNCLKNILSKGDTSDISNSPSSLQCVQEEVKRPEINENKKSDILEDRDLFTEENEDVIDLIQSEQEPDLVENTENFSEDESNVEKSYWSFIQHEKKKQKSPETKQFEDKENFITTPNDLKRNKPNTELQRNLSDDSATRDLDIQFQKIDQDANVDCIILSSGSDSQPQENIPKPQPSRTPSPIEMNCEVPYFDPYDNFHCFSEEQFSPVGVHSQSLITGDISVESVKLPDVPREDERPLEESKRPVGYCSTPVTVRRPSTTQSSSKKSTESSKRRKKCDLTASRILRKSLGLQRKSRLSSTKRNSKKKDTNMGKDFAEAITNSILHELSKSSIFQSSPPARRKSFVEITPISNRDEFVDSVTPSPNYSNMGESLLKEQLTKYGLKRNLAKSKAKKILRHIYEELHPLYNLETGKIVKKLSNNTPKAAKKSKPKEAPRKNTKLKKTTTDASDKTKVGKKPKNHCNSSKESDEMSDLSFDRLTDSAESDFENLSETLTQSAPSNPVDLPSAFCDFLQSNPDYHEKILLYEPIWMEDLQKKLKEAYKKHFKMSDLMDYLDQKCITFRSQAQARSLQRRNERRKEKMNKRKNHST